MGTNQMGIASFAFSEILSASLMIIIIIIIIIIEQI